MNMPIIRIFKKGNISIVTCVNHDTDVLSIFFRKQSFVQIDFKNNTMDFFKVPLCTFSKYDLAYALKLALNARRGTKLFGKYSPKMNSECLYTILECLKKRNLAKYPMTFAEYNETISYIYR